AQPRGVPRQSMSRRRPVRPGALLLRARFYTQQVPLFASYADVVLPVPLDQAFTYGVPEGAPPQPGARVLVPWRGRQLTGVALRLRADLPPGVDAAKLKPIAAVLDAEPLLDAAMLELVGWAATYYQAPIGEVMRCALPPGKGRAPAAQTIYALASPPAASPRLTPAQTQIIELLRSAGGELDAVALRQQASASAIATLLRRGVLARSERALAPAPPVWAARPRVLALNPSQQHALDALARPEPRPVLLHGVTGSGKTAVYIAAIERELARGGAALVLVPEIGLTPALFADFHDAFPGQVGVLHSSLSDGERACHWHRLRQGAARVAIGTRSAVFAPVARLGLIVVDEEHDASFKQFEAPRYHARDLAVMRAKLAGARIVLGSATPSLESLAHARAGKYALVEMRQRATPRALPAIRLVDMGEEFRRVSAARGPRPGPVPEMVFSADLRAALADRLARGQQSVILINRRGYAPVALCRNCGNHAACRDCALALSFHRREHRMLCHLCGYSTPPPATCSQCGSEHIYFLGAGSEKIEEELAALLPLARIARLDRDSSTSRRHFETVLAQFRAGAWDVLVGTQMIAKGHDLPGVTLVGVLQADLGLAFPDFRAAERTFQLLTQVAGRAGRGEAAGEVLFQVVHPEHYAVTCAAAGDFAGFFEKEANFRRWMHYPPFAALASVQLRHRQLAQVQAYAEAAAQHLRQAAAAHPAIRIMGPAPALLARAKGEHRMQFLFKSESRRELSALLRGLRAFARASKFPATTLVVDVDPLNL
ncbi:MAG: replication restart helicase PriA, partial [Terriglobales bacterium]